MNGPHDMGGMQCYGPVILEPNEPYFHGEWEKKALALTVAMGMTGSWNLDVSRFARESIPPADYLSNTYYEIWLAGLQQLMLDRGMVEVDELSDGVLRTKGTNVRRTVAASEIPGVLAKGGPVDRPVEGKPAYGVGDKVRTIKANPTGHTRLPRYARDAVGEIEAICGFHVFPDSNAKGDGENPQWLYTVRFSSRELFGEGEGGGHEIHLDLWEPYFDHA